MNQIPKSDIRAHITVSGIVQGVFFRATTQSEATRLRVSGWVRNKHDGTVEITAEGKKERVEKLIQWCHQGPPGAVVENIKLTREEYKGEFDSFTVMY